MKKSFSIMLLLQILLGSCQKHDILESKLLFCEAAINGVTHKDAPTVRESLGIYSGLPFALKQRCFVTRDTIAYLQFKLTNDDNPNDYCYLFGGIAFSKNETFPLLNKEYRIEYHQEFETDRRAADNFNNYLYDQREKAPDSLPLGIFFLKDKDKDGEWKDCYVSLQGVLEFESFNSKNGKYQGRFLLYRKNNESEIGDYTITGRCDVDVCKI